jgi:hypothetical protein
VQHSASFEVSTIARFVRRFHLAVPIDAPAEEAVLGTLQRTGPCGMDELVMHYL